MSGSLPSQTAHLLLHRIPEHDRAPVVQRVATSLDLDSANAADLDFAVTLLHLHPDGLAEHRLLDFLEQLVQRGRLEHVLNVASRHQTLNSQLTHRALVFLDTVARQLRAEPRKWIAVPLATASAASRAGPANDKDSHVSAAAAAAAAVTVTVTEADITSVVDRAVHTLDVLSRVISPHADHDLHRALFQHCIFFIGVADQTLAKAAQRSLFALLSSGHSLRETSVSDLWERIQNLVSVDHVFYKTLGVSLWLRWLLSEQAAIVVTVLQQPVYWHLIVDCLRNGDPERRKAALQILRASVDIASQSPLVLAPTRAAGSRSTETTTDALQKQYSRFCTIFETIVLGRYLNQVQECEPDLDFLASSQSHLTPVWLNTLLVAALDHKLQDSNRKFIGTWVMRSKPQLDDVNVFLDFFGNAFLPWATGGSLFTSSLREKDGILRCEHGDALAAYVRDVILNHPNVAGRIIDSILDTILARYGNNFAYSMVYLIDGIGHSFDSGSGRPAVEASHIEKIRRIAGWPGFPEVARDYILARSWKICHDQDDGGLGSEKHSALWKALQNRLAHLQLGASAHVDGNIASLALEPSKRDQHERKAIKKCLDLVAELDGLADQAGTGRSRIEVVDDIWSDLDYLEYPKSLLVVLPTLIPHPRFVQIVQEEPDSGGQLADLLATRVNDLLELSESRSYLLAPLMRAIRAVVFKQPHAATLVNLERAVMQVADHPPAPTIDARLEDATVALLKTLGPGMEKLNYEYYFGPRETHGFAAVLDIVSRLGNIDADMNEALFFNLLTRWREQKVPPPSVSHWKTTLQLQVMLLCCEQHMSMANSATAKTVLKDLQYILAIEPLPRYRYLLEWMIARVYIHHPALRLGLLEELRTKDHHSNPKFLASLMKLGVMLSRIDESDEAFAQELATVFVPLAASSKVIIRHEAQWQIPVLMDHANLRGWTSVSQDTSFLALDHFIRSLERFGDPPLERQIDRLDPIRDHNLTHLVSGPWYELDAVEQRQTSRQSFLALHDLAAATTNTTTTTYRLPESCMPLGDPAPSPSAIIKSNALIPTKVNHSRRLLQNIDNISRALGSGPVSPTTSSLALQTKGAAYLSSDPVTRHTHLLVIASLIDNPYNLGGLSRVSEIFGAKALYLQNPNVTSNKDFTNVSVSSHLHFPILPLAPANLPSFLAEKKSQESYTVVGIEQTDRSVLLGSEKCLLPENCILVLGSEREGIPAAVLVECDMLVEIPQVGVTRSLNVQTAAGIVLCEYGRQHGRKN